MYRKKRKLSTGGGKLACVLGEGHPAGGKTFFLDISKNKMELNLASRNVL